MINLSPDDMVLYMHIDEALFYKWDPIGISDDLIARTEYQSYTPQVFLMVKRFISAKKIAEHLTMIEKERMRLDISHFTKNKNLKLATELLEFHAKSIKK